MAIISDDDGDNENPNGGDGEGGNTVRSEAQVSILTEAAVDLESGEARELSLVLNPSALVLAEVSDLVEVEQVCSGVAEATIGEVRGGVQLQNQKSSSPWVKNQRGGSEKEAVCEVVDGVATMVIPEEIFDEAELLWKSFVVGYFIGDALHVGSIHATVNRIWSFSKTGSKIDVQFTEKNTVLFRIENSQMRTRVLQRKY